LHENLNDWIVRFEGTFRIDSPVEGDNLTIIDSMIEFQSMIESCSQIERQSNFPRHAHFFSMAAVWAI
jgi:hypothetical protein